MRLLLISLALTLPAHAGLLDNLSTAVGGHIKDFKSRSAPDQVLSGAQELRTGVFRENDPGQDTLHYGAGSFALVAKGSEVYIQLQPDVEIGFAPDLFLYVSTQAQIDDEASFVSAPTVELGELVKGKGASYYPVVGIEPDAIQSVTVWCKAFGEFMASGQLKP